MLEELAVPTFCAVFFGGLGVLGGWYYRGLWENCDKTPETEVAKVQASVIMAKAKCYDYICSSLGINCDVIGYINTHYVKKETAEVVKSSESDESVEDSQGSEK